MSTFSVLVFYCGAQLWEPFHCPTGTKRNWSPVGQYGFQGRRVQLQLVLLHDAHRFRNIFLTRMVPSNSVPWFELFSVLLINSVIVAFKTEVHLCVVLKFSENFSAKDSYGASKGGHVCIIHLKAHSH